MTDAHIIVSIERDLEDLIPTYMTNRAREVKTLRALLASSDMDQLSRLGHRMKGVGEPYGFDKVSTLGKLIEDGAKSGDRIGLEKWIAEYGDYLARVRIVYK